MTTHPAVLILQARVELDRNRLPILVKLLHEVGLQNHCKNQMLLKLTSLKENIRNKSEVEAILTSFKCIKEMSMVLNVNALLNILKKKPVTAKSQPPQLLNPLKTQNQSQL